MAETEAQTGRVAALVDHLADRVAARAAEGITGTPPPVLYGCVMGPDQVPARAARRTVVPDLSGTARGLGLHHVRCTRCQVGHVVPGDLAGTVHGGGCGGTLREVGA